MCIAILQETGKVLTRKQIRNCWQNNSDGAGIAWIQGGTIKIHKELKSFRRFYKSYRSIVKEFGEKSNMLIHFRYSTQGLVNLDNCHPHLVNENTCFIHNGIITLNKVCKLNSDDSDTVLFNKRILQKLPVDFMYRQKVIKHIDKLADSILVFLNSDNYYVIIGEDMGHWKDGIWFSNYDYEYTKYRTKYSGYTSEYAGGYWSEGIYYGWNTTRQRFDKFNTKKETYKNKPRILTRQTNTTDRMSNEIIDMIKCDDPWNRYEAENLGDDIKTDGIIGRCHRCQCYSENMIGVDGVYYCEECACDMRTYVNQYNGKTLSQCHECGIFDENLIMMGGNFYCSICYQLFSK
jgi:predicted glutamine amidotransferase